MTIRDEVVSTANSLRGLAAPDPNYMRLVAEWEVDNGDTIDATQIAKASDCALVAWGILETAGISLPSRGKYKAGSAITMLVDAAKKAGAYIVGGLPSHRDQYFGAIVAGNVVHLAPCPGHEEHIGTITSVVDSTPPRPRITTKRVDGGRRTPAGLETIEEVNHVVYTFIEWGKEMETGRIIAGTIDVEALYTYYNGQTS